MRSRPILALIPPTLALAAAIAVGLASEGLSADALVGYSHLLAYGSIGALLASGVIWYASHRGTSTSSLALVNDAVTELTEIRLPALLGSLGDADAATPKFPEFELGTRDDQIRLATALNRLQSTSTELVEGQQKALQNGIGELVTNMARRNQGLVDRQIDVIDRLEAQEEDPHRLEDLFSLDHLATRMRRNAESLLVLSGADSTKRRGGPVSMVDVLRVAMGEIEDYRHITLDSVDDQMLSTQTALDLAHLVSELLENAAQFSPPTSSVKVSGTQSHSGSYMISIKDQGIGMAEEQLAKANSTLGSPPALGLGMNRSLGFVVVGRLARRLGLRVELSAGAQGGITAVVELPRSSIDTPGTTKAPSHPDADQLYGDNSSSALAASHRAPAPARLSQNHADSSPNETVASETSPAETDALASRISALAKSARDLLPPQDDASAAIKFESVAESKSSGAETKSSGAAEGTGDSTGLADPTISLAVAGPMDTNHGETFAVSAFLDVSDPAPETAATQGQVPVPCEPSSDALTRLLGLTSSEGAATPAPAPTEPEIPERAAPPRTPEPTTWAERTAQEEAANTLREDASQFPAELAPQPVSELSPEESAWVPPVFDEALLGDLDILDPQDDFTPGSPVAGNPEPPSRLAEAMPDVGSFDTDVAALLNAGTQDPSTVHDHETGSGLKHRDRNAALPSADSGGQRVAASSRSPEEIRSMLARYRTGLSGQHPDSPAGSSSPGDALDRSADPSYAASEGDPFDRVIRPPAPPGHTDPRPQADSPSSAEPLNKRSSDQTNQTFQSDPFGEDPFDPNPFGNQR